MDKTTYALKRALNLIDYLEYEKGLYFHGDRDVIREALAEQPAQQQEPFCYFYIENGEEFFAPKNAYVPDDAKPLYTSPQPAQQEPVALRQLVEQALKGDLSGDSDADLALILKARKELAGIASPPASKPWVGLTEEERGQVYSDWRWNGSNSSNLELIRAIEAKLREKNT